MDDTTRQALGRVRLGMQQASAKGWKPLLRGGASHRGWTAWGEPITVDAGLDPQMLEVLAGGQVVARVRFDPATLPHLTAR